MTKSRIKENHKGIWRITEAINLPPRDVQFRLETDNGYNVAARFHLCTSATATGDTIHLYDDESRVKVSVVSNLVGNNSGGRFLRFLPNPDRNDHTAHGIRGLIPLHRDQTGKLKCGLRA